MKRVAVVVATVAAAGFVLVGLLAFVPVWPCSLIEHFRVQYLLGGIAIVAGAWCTRLFDAALIAWLIDFAAVAPHMHGAHTDRDGVHVRILWANVLATNTHFDRVRALIAETQPDVVALTEVYGPWASEIAPALAGYEKLEDLRPDFFATGVYVRGKLDGAIEHVGSDLPTIVADVVLPRVQFTMVVTHPWPPVNGWAEDKQYAHLAAVAHRLRELRGPIVLAADLNATPWSRVFRKLAGTSGLCDTRASYDGSYPSDSWLVRVPIDHVLVSCDIGVRDRRIGPDIGSDHLPVIVDLTF